MLFSISSRLGDADLQSLHQDARSTGVCQGRIIHCIIVLIDMFDVPYLTMI